MGPEGLKEEIMEQTSENVVGVVSTVLLALHVLATD